MLVTDYLKEEGYQSSVIVLQDEANMKTREATDLNGLVLRINRRILEGEWSEVDKLLGEITRTADHRSFREICLHLSYETAKQQYLELINRQELTKAFQWLKKRLKPLQGSCGHPKEFSDLCYLLTCTSVNEAESFKEWGGVNFSREKLTGMFDNLLRTSQRGRAILPSNQQQQHQHQQHHPPSAPNPGRLVRLLKQAVLYQLEHSSSSTSSDAKHSSKRSVTLLSDVTSYALPSTLKHTLQGHHMDVKSVVFLGTAGDFFASGSSDKTIRVWHTGTGKCKSTLAGHTSKIWTLACDSQGRTLLSGGANGRVRIWNTETSKCVEDHTFHSSPVYSVDINKPGTHYASAGYDSRIRTVDLASSKVTVELKGHTALISSVVFNNTGNLIVSGSRDCSVKFWDASSGSCVRTIGGSLGEVTSVSLSQDECYVLSSSKDNSIRLWDLRMGHMACVKKYTGHQNTWKNFIKSCFGPNDEMVVSGSEDGHVYMWDRESASIIQKQPAHGSSIVYCTRWNAARYTLLSSSHDGSVKAWSDR
mmetsp:Transcript_25218/g.49335  ORF Transcript_25218/g.49335 Transcript_25218/m.49335 type:complete len:534 (-) Transcript_25218:140-1741(-)